VIAARIKALRLAYLLQEVEPAEYVSELEQLWVRVCCMARKKGKHIKTEMITCLDMPFDFGGDVGKELELMAKAKKMGLLPSTTKPNLSDVAPKMM